MTIILEKYYNMNNNRNSFLVDDMDDTKLLLQLLLPSSSLSLSSSKIAEIIYQSKNSNLNVYFASLAKIPMQVHANMCKWLLCIQTKKTTQSDTRLSSPKTLVSDDQDMQMKLWLSSSSLSLFDALITVIVNDDKVDTGDSSSDDQIMNDDDKVDTGDSRGKI